MGSVCQCAEEVIDLLTKQGEKVGMLEVHLYRPFVVDKFIKALPATAKKIAVLDRTIEQGSLYEPLALDVQAAFYGKADAPVIVAGRYGLSSKDTTPEQIVAVFENLKKKSPKDHFTIGINDDIRYSNLPLGNPVDVADPSTTELLFFGLGSDGTVGDRGRRPETDAPDQFLPEAGSRRCG